MKKLILVMSIVGATNAVAQVQNFKPVTQEMLLNPSPDDWLMFSRTYDAQRCSPLKQINAGVLNPTNEGTNGRLGQGGAGQVSRFAGGGEVSADQRMQPGR